MTESRISGLLLILAVVLFAVGAGLPTLRKGNARIYTMPAAQQLRAIGRIPKAWAWANVFMAAASIVLMLGLSMLADGLEEVGGTTLAHLGLISFMFAAVMWVILCAHRGQVPILVAGQIGDEGETPTWYEATGRWVGALFEAYAIMAFLSLIAFGAAFIQTGLLSPWVGWTTIIFSAALLVLLLIMGDTLPAFHYLPSLLIGIMLLAG